VAAAAGARSRPRRAAAAGGAAAASDAPDAPTAPASPAIAEQPSCWRRHARLLLAAALLAAAISAVALAATDAIPLLPLLSAVRARTPHAFPAALPAGFPWRTRRSYQQPFFVPVGQFEALQPPGLRALCCALFLVSRGPSR
jgi:hypothetical protein